MSLHGRGAVPDHLARSVADFIDDRIGHAPLGRTLPPSAMMPLLDGVITAEGLGAEVAVSTQRLHVRGPMGLRELTTYKWVAQGDYHVRQ